MVGFTWIFFGLDCLVEEAGGGAFFGDNFKEGFLGSGLVRRNLNVSLVSGFWHQWRTKWASINNVSLPPIRSERVTNRLDVALLGNFFEGFFFNWKFGLAGSFQLLLLNDERMVTQPTASKILVSLKIAITFKKIRSTFHDTVRETAWSLW